MKLARAVVITGSIGSGKSSISCLLKERGYRVICADEIAHEVLDSIQAEIIGAFGSEVLESRESGLKISRKKLGALIFQDVAKRKKLEALTHPKIRKMILHKAQILESSEKFYFLDIPLFFEIGGREAYDVAKVALVYAPKGICLLRIIKRDNLDKPSALVRLNAQMDIERKRKKSDFVIENTKDLAHLQEVLKVFLESLERDFRHD